jgi:vitamin B12 transporter
MRFFAGLVSVLVCVTAASAAELKIKVIDPQSAAVAGAHVELLEPGGTVPLGIKTSSAEGLAVFRTAGPGPYAVRVFAQGFAEQRRDVPASSSAAVTVQLGLASAAETIVVTATRSPVPSESAGAEVESLSSNQLQVMNPIAANDGLRFLPGAIVDTTGQRGGLASLFVRGGDSTYNKVIVDGVTINTPGGGFDFGTLPLTEADHLEFMRGAQSTLYGSDAMTSVVQVWTRTGSTPIPELRFGADGGNLGTGHGYAALAGARGRFDYDLFGDQFNTGGEGINDAYSDSLEGANLGVALSGPVSLRVRFRHSNSHTGVPGEWDFNGAPLEPPDPGEWSQLNDLIGSVELTVVGPSGWQHRFTGFDYNYRYTDVNLQGDPARVDAFGNQFDFPSHQADDINRAGFEYQGDDMERSWTHSTFGFRTEDENGFLGDLDFPPQTHGQRLNDDVYGQQQVILGRLSVIAGARFVHNSEFGNAALPRVALTWLAWRGGETFSGTRLHFSYATGFKEPGLDQTFAGPPFFVANPGLRPERNRALEAGFQQGFWGGRYALTATYFNNLFRDQIEYATADPVTFAGQYFNVNRSLAHGAEVELEAKITSTLSLNTSYTYTSTQILEAPLCTPANFCDTVYDAGNPFLRRPKHSGSLLLTYLGKRWGGNLGGSFVGRRFDSDFLGFGIDHAAGYVRVDLGGWYAMNSRVTAYANVENVLDKSYNEVVGYPALPVNFRLGLRVRIGGE